WDQFKDPDDGRFDASAFLADNAYGFLPMPIIITDPAVDGGLGLVGLFFHETDEQKEKRLEALRNSENGSQFLLTPSVSAVAGATTGNDSWFVGGGHMGFFRQGRIRYMGGTGYGDVNLDFFGFGEVQMVNPLELNTKAAMVMQSVRFRIGESSFFVGPTQTFVDARISPKDLGDLAGDILPPEFQDRWQEFVRNLLTQDVRTSALGVVVDFDSRDNFFSPHAGYRYELEHSWYRDFLGSDIEYELSSLSGTNYWNVTDKFRAALKVAVDYASTGSLLPPFATPGIELRGIPALRYQGNFVGVAEAEVTWQVDDRWSVSIFGGSGRAANSYSEFKDAPSRNAKGAGFRYLVARRYGFEMGVDIARGPEEDVFYIQGGTAWR
ncbi:MAG: BamA/TamA family outer membrane protein, partial [Woeseiaceae bacterium]